MQTSVVSTHVRYLVAKKPIDDRSLNRHVYGALARGLARLGLQKPLRVLELGAGIGTMLARLLEWGLFSRADYTAIDSHPAFQSATVAYLSDWAKIWDYQLDRQDQGGLRLRRPGYQVDLTTATVDLFDYLVRTDLEPFDLVIAHAFLDLVDLPSALPRIMESLTPTGYAYFTLNFDGDTIFEPILDPELDAQIERLYHQSMDDRRRNGRPAGDSRTGRHLFTHLRQAGAQLMAAGSSDWVVFPVDGGYPDGEDDFLRFILDTIANGLEMHLELDPERFAAWLAQRRRQIEQGQLVYIAHQLDFLASR
jgi:SAM-dependent methyltransferase